jgi:hypothetical protein
MDTSFKCKHCGQEYKCEEDLFSIAVFIYGIFFLTDGKYGYTGITCPRCLKTITNEGEIGQAKYIWSSASFFQAFEIHQLLNLRYHSSFDSLKENLQAYGKNGVKHWDRIRSELDEDLATFRGEIDEFQKISNLHENYFCTYAFDDDLPMGSFVVVGWFPKDAIDYFTKIENDNSLRIFPRYIHYNSTYDDIEQFCWENYSSMDYKKNIHLPVGMKFSDNIDDRKIHIPTDFLSILIDDPLPLGFDFLKDVQLKSFWKTINPFFNKEFKNGFFDCDLAEFEIPQKKPGHDEKAALVKEKMHKSFVQDLLHKHHLNFIKEYIKLSKKIDFSYAAIWQLKEIYLDRLYDAIVTKQSSGIVQRHRIECRKVAERIWKDEIKKKKPITTIADMMHKDEINKLFEKRVYSEKTMRDWLKELCPNRKPGRPRGQKK